MKKCQNFELYITVTYEQSSSNCENFRYSESPLLKLGAVEFAVLFQRFLHGLPKENADGNGSNVDISSF